MKTILSNDYLIWIEKCNDEELYSQLIQNDFNWCNFEVGDSVYIDTEKYDYEYTIEYINHDRQLIILA